MTEWPLRHFATRYNTFVTVLGAGHYETAADLSATCLFLHHAWQTKVVEIDETFLFPGAFPILGATIPYLTLSWRAIVTMQTVRFVGLSQSPSVL